MSAIFGVSVKWGEVHVLHPGVVRLIADADERHHLSQRERIALGLLGQAESMSAAELADGLDVSEADGLRPWLGRLVEQGLVVQTGRTLGTRYHVAPNLLREAGLDQKTALERIEPHRLRALIVEDVARYPDSAATEIHQRVGLEIPERTFPSGSGGDGIAGVDICHRQDSWTPLRARRIRPRRGGRPMRFGHHTVSSGIP